MNDLQKLAERLSSLERRVAALEGRFRNVARQPTSKDTKGLSVREFMLTIKPTNDVAKTLAIAYYLEKYEGVASFNVDDIARCFQLAKEPAPENINDKINMNIRKGHIAEAKEKKNGKKAWFVSNSGEQFLVRGFHSRDT